MKWLRLGLSCLFLICALGARQSARRLGKSLPMNPESERDSDESAIWAPTPPEPPARLATAILAIAAGALAIGFVAFAAVAIGRLAIGNLALGRGEARELKVGRLAIGELRLGRIRRR